MGLTAETVGLNLLRESFNIKNDNKQPVIALAGNPNTGKSTIFNGLTGLRQHTGNWPGKTATRAQGLYIYNDEEFIIIDLPGTYSLLANSTEEIIARDFICFARPDATIVVADATNLERNLNLVLQVLELTNNVILVVNLMDEARRKKIQIDINSLESSLQIPVIPAVARDGKGLEKIKEIIYQIINKKILIQGIKMTYSQEIENEIEQIIPELKSFLGPLVRKMDLRWLALRLLEGDETILESIDKYFPDLQGEEIILQSGGIQVDGIS